MKNIIVLSAAILLSTLTSYAQIEGRVTDAKGNAIANATVKAYGPEGPGKKVKAVTTDENGQYSFEGLATGKYDISVIAEKFDVLIKHGLIVADEEETPAVDFALSPDPRAIAPRHPTPKGYVPGMTALIAEMNGFTGLTPPQAHLDISARFLKIGDEQKTEWLPYYYAAFAVANYGWMLHSDQDANADKGNAILDKAEALSKGNSEIYIVRAMFAQQQMMVAPYTRYASFGVRSGNAMETAKKLNPDNPRVYLMLGQSLFGTPDQFGGGKAKAKPLFEEAVRKFDAFRPESSLSPNWGRQQAVEMLKQSGQ